MKLIVKSLVNWRLLLLGLALAGGLTFFASNRVAYAQSDCIDPATGAACTPVPPPSCGVAGAPPCEPPPTLPPSRPKPTKTPTPRPLPTRTPTPTAIISCDTSYLTAVMTATNEVPPVRTEGQGIVSLFLDLNNGTITGNWQISNLNGSITAAHIHDGLAGVKGGVFLPFSGLPIGGSFATVDNAPVAKLKAILDDPSRYYVNVHSTTYPGGEIRGQLVCAPAQPVASPTSTLPPRPTEPVQSTLPSRPTEPTLSPTPKPFLPVKQQPLDIFKPADIVKPFLVPQPDIEIVKIEITQAIQCLQNTTCPDNSVLLYSGKPTMVRVYVRLAPGAYSSVSNIGGRLCLGNKGQGGCGAIAVASSSVNSLNKATVKKGASPGSDRTDLNATINFLLPPDWVKNAGADLGIVQAGKPLEFTVFVNYLQKDFPFEIKYDNNFKSYKFNIWPSQPLGVVFVPVTTNGFTASTSEMHSILSWLRLVYPTSDFRFGYVPGPFYWNTNWGGDCGGFGGLLFNLAWNRGLDQRLWYGMVDKRAGEVGPNKPGASGCGNTVLGISDGFVGYGDRNTGEIAAQELAHNLHKDHAPGCGAGNPDPKYPKWPNGNLDEVGVDPLRQQLYLPYLTYDYMGYCGSENNTWTSLYTYRSMAASLPNGGFKSAQSHIKMASLTLGNPGDRAYFVLDGSVSPDGVDIFNGLYRMDVSTGEFPKLEDGPFAVELLNAKGEVIYSQSFAPTGNSNDEHLDPPLSGYFFLALPWDERTQEVRFSYNGQELKTIKASRRAPKAIWVSTDDAGQADSDMVKIAWEASDQDNDPLQVQIEYSPDDGASWSILATNPEGNSLEIDSTTLAGGDSARLRLRVSDGFNTTVADSDLFQISNKSLEAFISWPEDGAQFKVGAAIYLTGLGLDLEDGSLDPDKLHWTSDIDGDLGNGDLLVDSLSVGEHALTVEAVDSAGARGETKVHITILPPDPETESVATLDPTVERTLNYMVYGVMIFALVIASLLVTLVILWRKARQ
jgi:hypothetical protein